MLTYAQIAVLLVVTHGAAFWAGASYGMAKLRSAAVEVMRDLDAQLEHLGVRITEEAHEKLGIALAWVRYKLGL